MWTLVITLALKLLEWFLDKSKADKETMERFYDFVEQADKNELLNSVKLRDSYKEQLKKLKEGK